MIALLRRFWPVLAAFVVVVLLIGGAYRHGYTAARNECEAAKVQAAQEVARQTVEHVEAAQAVDSRNIEASAAIDARARVITREVVRYVESHPEIRACSIDADGLRLWNAANSGTDPAGADPAAEPDAEMR